MVEVARVCQKTKWRDHTLQSSRPHAPSTSLTHGVDSVLHGRAVHQSKKKLFKNKTQKQLAVRCTSTTQMVCNRPALYRLFLVFEMSLLVLTLLTQRYQFVRAYVTFRCIVLCCVCGPLCVRERSGLVNNSKTFVLFEPSTHAHGCYKIYGICAYTFPLLLLAFDASISFRG